MTNEEFLKTIEAYRAIIQPETFQSLVDAVKADKFNDEAKEALLWKIQSTQQTLATLNQAKQERNSIYQKGIQDLNAIEHDVRQTYKTTMKAAEDESQKQDATAADTILQNF